MLNRPINTEYSHLIKYLGIDEYIATLAEEILRSGRRNYQWSNDGT
jgi:hypothetical protein